MSVKYQEFKVMFRRALEQEQLLGWESHEDRLNLESMSRTHESFLGGIANQDAEPIHVSCRIHWTWDALQSARTATIEEDVLTELFGREEAHALDTEVPWLRVDVALRGSLPMDSPMVMPHSRTWKRWQREVADKVITLMAVDESPESWPIPSFHFGDPSGSFVVSADGELALSEVSLESWHGIFLPRVWDDPDRDPDPDPSLQVGLFAMRLRRAIEAWTACTRILRISVQ